MKTPLSPRQKEACENEIKLAQKMIDKEMSYSEEFRNYSEIDNLKAHIADMEDMIKTGWNAPQFN